MNPIKTLATLVAAALSCLSTGAQVTNIYQDGVNGYFGTTAADISTETGGNGITLTANVNTSADADLPDWLISYECRVLLRFDHLNLPRGAIVQSARLQLVIEYDGADNGFALLGHYLRTAWNPSSATNTLNGLGWFYRDNTLPWTVPGGTGDGTDVIAGKSFTVSGSSTYIQTDTVELDPAAVQAWANNATNNYGVILANQTTNEIARIFAPWHANIAYHPQLTIIYKNGTSPTVAQAATAVPNPVGGTTNAVSVLGADTNGEAALTYTWSAAEEPAGATDPVFSPNGNNAAKNALATYSTPGNYVLQAVVQNAPGLTATSTVTVVVQELSAGIQLTPTSAKVVVGQSRQFHALAVNQFGQPLASQPSFAWSVSGGGTVDPGGNFTAGLTPGGPYVLVAQSGGIRTTSTVVVALPNLPPLVTLSSPANGQNFALPTNVNLVATASDPDGSVTNVEFLVNGAKIGEAKNPPYTLVWASPAPGTYTVLARAWDNDGASSNSVPAVITVSAPGHPRLWLDAGTLTKLRAKVSGQSADWLALKQQCDRYLGSTVYDPTGPTYPDSTPDVANIGAGYQGSGYADPVFELGLAYQALKTSNPVLAARYAQKGRDLLYAMSLPGNDAIAADSGFGVRFYGVDMAMGYDWLYDALTQSDRDRVYQSLQAWLANFETNSFYYVSDPNIQGNYMAGYYAAAGLTALATEYDYPEAEARWNQWLTNTHYGRFQPYYSTWLTGGGWPEGWSYGQLATLNLTYPVWGALTAKGLDLVHTSPAFTFPADQSRYLMYFSWPSQQRMDDRGMTHSGINPTGWNPSFLQSEAGLATLLGADWAGYFHRFAREIRSAIANGVFSYPPSDSSPLWEDFLLWDENAPEEDYRRMPRSYEATGMNMAAVRSSWDTNAVWGSFTSGPYVNDPGSGEEFFDQGSLAIVRGDVPLLVNATGYAMRHTPGTTDGDTYENYLVYPDGSGNTDSNPLLGQRTLFNILYAKTANGLHSGQSSIDPLTQLGNPDGSVFPPRTRLSAFEDDGDFAYLQGTHLEDVYNRDQNGDPVVSGWSREVIYLRPKLFVVYDQTSVTNITDQYVGFHLPRVPTAPPGTSNRFDVADAGTFAGAVTTLFPLGHTNRLVDIPCATDANDNNFISNKVWRLEVRPTDGALDQHWMTILDAAASSGEVCGVSRISAADGNLLAGNFIGTILSAPGSNGVVLFSQAPVSQPTAGPVQYVVPVAETLHVVCGLEPNTAFSITTGTAAGNLTVQISNGGSWLSTASGLLAFRTHANGGVSALDAPAPQLAFRPFNSTAAGPRLYLRGGGARSWIIESSTNLFSWHPESTNQAADGIVYFNDLTPVSGTTKFYRARQSP